MVQQNACIQIIWNMAKICTYSLDWTCILEASVMYMLVPDRKGHSYVNRRSLDACIALFHFF